MMTLFEFYRDRQWLYFTVLYMAEQHNMQDKIKVVGKVYMISVYLEWFSRDIIVMVDIMKYLLTIGNVSNVQRY